MTTIADSGEIDRRQVELTTLETQAETDRWERHRLAEGI